jgi:hypothetical protein
MGSMILKLSSRHRASAVRLSELNVVKNAVMVPVLPQTQNDSLTTQLYANLCGCDLTEAVPSAF